MSCRHVSFEGSLTKTLRFWTSKLHFWRKSLAETLRFWVSKRHFCRKSRRNGSFFESQSLIFEGNLAETLRFWASKLHFLNFKSVDQIEWFASQLNLTANGPQTNWISKQLNLESEFELIWIPHHLNPKHYLTLKSLEHCNPKSMIGTQITWNSASLQSNFHSQINLVQCILKWKWIETWNFHWNFQRKLSGQGATLIESVQSKCQGWLKLWLKFCSQSVVVVFAFYWKCFEFQNFCSRICQKMSKSNPKRRQQLLLFKNPGLSSEKTYICT